MARHGTLASGARGARRRRAALLVALAGGAGAAACYDFTFDAADGAVDGGGGVDDAGRRPADAERDAALDDAGLCPAGRSSCGGHLVAGPADQIFRCEADGGTTRLAKCANGCAVAAAGLDDACRPPTPCELNGRYCGGDKVNGDPDVLYRCGTGGSVSVHERCKARCVVADAGFDDYCAP